MALCLSSSKEVASLQSANPGTLLPLVSANKTQKKT